MRKPIQLVELNGTLAVLCDDGTIWVADDARGWIQEPEIPQEPHEPMGEVIAAESKYE